MKCDMFQCPREAEWFAVIGKTQDTVNRETVVEDFRLCDHHKEQMETSPESYRIDRILVKSMKNIPLCWNCGRNGIPGKLARSWCAPCMTEWRAPRREPLTWALTDHEGTLIAVSADPDYLNSLMKKLPHGGCIRRET